LTALASLLLIVSSVCTTARLALHFDINKTIIMIDSGMATPIQHVLNSILADSACGQGSHEQPLVWVWDGLDPEWNKCPRGRDVKGLSPTSRMTYAAYLSHVRGVARPVRREHILRFTHAGEPGEGLQPLLQRLAQNLIIPAADTSTAARHVLLLPSFLELVAHLHSQRVGFSIAFRTFGEDLDAVAKEWNSLCAGKHPLYPGLTMDGSDGGEDHRLSPENRLHVVHRDDQGMTLNIGTASLPPGSREWGAREGNAKQRQQCTAAASQCSEDTRAGRGFYEAMQGVHTLSSPQAIGDYLRAKAERGETIGVVEDWAWWHAEGEVASAAKPLVLEPQDPAVHTIYLDDNVRAADAYVVDIRDSTGAVIPFSLTQGRHALASSPLKAILERRYFIDLIQECHSRWKMEMSSQLLVD